jgi:hexulose-6-phosphate isomerase
MYLAINYWFFDKKMDGGAPMEEAMAQARDAGFEGFEPCVGGGGTLHVNSSEKRCKEIADCAKELGIRISSVASGMYWGCSLSSPRKSERDKAVKMTQKMLQITQWLGSKHLLVVPANVGADFVDPDSPVPYDQAYKNAMASMKKIARTAEKLKVYACVENVWNKFLYTPFEYRDFIKNVGSRWVGAYYDPANTIICGYPEHWIPLLGSKIKRVHIKDFDRTNPVFPAGFDLAFGKGCLNWDEVIKALKKVKYDGPLTAEYIPPHPPYDDDTAKDLKKLKRDIDKTLKL